MQLPKGGGREPTCARKDSASEHVPTDVLRTPEKKPGSHPPESHPADHIVRSRAPAKATKEPVAQSSNNERECECVGDNQGGGEGNREQGFQHRGPLENGAKGDGYEAGPYNDCRRGGRRGGGCAGGSHPRARPADGA